MSAHRTRTRRRPTIDREETPDEKLDRNTIELLNELRIAATGIQVMFAFLLVVPFNTGWKKTTLVRAHRLLRHAGVRRDSPPSC